MLLPLTVALAPCLFILWYFIHRDRYEPEPKGLIIKVFLLGALMVIPAAVVEIGFSAAIGGAAAGLTAAFVESFVVVAPVEEFLKRFVVRRWVYASQEFDEVMDGIVYTVAASLGFAALENVFYVIEHGLGVGIVRAFLSVPGHAFFGAVMGYSIGLAKFEKARESYHMTTGLLRAIFLHGLFNFLLLTRTVLALGVIVLIVGLGFAVRKNLRRAEAQSRSRLVEKGADPDQTSGPENLP